MSGELLQIPLVDGPLEFRGALDLEQTESGLLAWRLPRWARAQFPNGSIERMAALSSGVRLAFATTATLLEVEALTTVTQYDDRAADATAGTLDLVIDGALAHREPLAIGNLNHVAHGMPTVTPGVASHVRFGPLPSGRKEIELWLPQGCSTRLVGLWADAEVLPPSGTGLPRWVHHGSSVSHCPDAASPADTWPMIAARLGRAEVINLSFAGNAMLDPFVARAIRDQPASIISLELGLNVVTGASFTLRSFGPAVHGFLDTIREGHSRVPLFVVSPIICPPIEDTPGPTIRNVDGTLRALGSRDDIPNGALTLNVVREELERIVSSRSTEDLHLHYLDGRDLFGTDDVSDLPDEVHPNAAGQQRMAIRFAQAVFSAQGHPPHA